MNKVVVREMLAADLPANIRGDIDPSHPVEITVRDLVDHQPAGHGRFSRHFHLVRPHYSSVDDVVDHIRRVRDGEP